MELVLDPPISANTLKRLQVSLRQSVPTFGKGALKRRRMGQSQEFREFREYMPGDDIRRVDWLASLRRGTAWERVSRIFEAEEQSTLAILVDCRPGMFLPEAIPKIQIAIWVAQCLAAATQSQGNRVVIGTLYGGTSDLHPVVAQGSNALKAARMLSKDVMNKRPTGPDWIVTPKCDTRAVIRQLRTTSAVVVISDLLFEPSDPNIRALAQAAQKGFRTLNIVELNTWPMERAMLAQGPLRLAGIDGRAASDKLADAPEKILAQADENLRAHRQTLRHTLNGPGLIWPKQAISWPASVLVAPNMAATLFQNQFPKAAALGALMSVMAS